MQAGEAQIAAASTPNKATSSSTLAPTWRQKAKENMGEGVGLFLAATLPHGALHRQSASSGQPWAQTLTQIVARHLVMRVCMRHQLHGRHACRGKVRRAPHSLNSGGPSGGRHPTHRVRNGINQSKKTRNGTPHRPQVECKEIGRPTIEVSQISQLGGLMVGGLMVGKVPRCRLWMKAQAPWSMVRGRLVPQLCL